MAFWQNHFEKGLWRFLFVYGALFLGLTLTMALTLLHVLVYHDPFHWVNFVYRLGIFSCMGVLIAFFVWYRTEASYLYYKSAKELETLSLARDAALLLNGQVDKSRLDQISALAEDLTNRE